MNKNIFIALLGAALFSSKPVIVKLLYSTGFTSSPVLFWRLFLALPFYIWLIYFYRRKYSYAQIPLYIWGRVIAVGIVGYFFASLLDLKGLEYISAPLERLIIFTYPAVILFFIPIIRKTPLSSKKLVIMLIAYAGLIILIGTEGIQSGSISQTLTGSFLVMASAISFALYMIWAKPIIHIIGSIQFAAYSMISATIATLIYQSFQGLSHINPLSYTSKQWILLLFMAVFCTVLPSILMSEANKRLGPETTSITSCIGPIVTVMLSFFILRENINFWDISGMAIIIVAMIMLGYEKNIDKKETT